MKIYECLSSLPFILCACDLSLLNSVFLFRDSLTWHKSADFIMSWYHVPPLMAWVPLLFLTRADTLNAMILWFSQEPELTKLQLNAGLTPQFLLFLSISCPLPDGGDFLDVGKIHLSGDHHQVLCNKLNNLGLLECGSLIFKSCFSLIKWNNDSYIMPHRVVI